MAREMIADVFKTIGQPTVTYVQRDRGKLEFQLNAALNERGQLCLVTGPSKTGKTTLYREILARRGEVPLIVPCDRNKTCEAIWKQALEAVDFERVESRANLKSNAQEAEVEVQTRIGWKWLADASTRFRGKLSRDVSDEEVKARVLADPGPDLLVPLLKGANYVLVIEDFHYLPDAEKVLLFQQWKRFIDNEVSVLVLGTTHRAVDIANSNRDLVGRIAQIDVGHWDKADLQEICFKGFKHLRVAIPQADMELISAEAVGLPIVVQQVCSNLLTSRGFEFADQVRKKGHKVKDGDVERSLHNVARQNYTQYESYYSTLISGPREKARKYRTYELVLACFTRNPIQFSLKRMELDRRMLELGLDANELPPPASLNSTLGALKKFQERRELEVLEWQPNEDKLYIVEPAFLFYVRWRTLRLTAPQQLDLFEELLSRTWSLDADDLPAGGRGR